MTRSQVVVDVSAVRANIARLRGVLGETELWAVVKADAYGHGAVDIAQVALDAGAGALCVATVGEALELRAVISPGARIVVLGPTRAEELRVAREARLELVVGDGAVPDGIEVHLKLDTGMGRWGLGELTAPGRNVVGLMTHLASADADPAFTQLQLERFLEATAPYAHLTRHVANSAAALVSPATRLDAARCGIAIYGIDPFGIDAAAHGLRPALTWSSYLASAKRLAPGQSTGYGRLFVAETETWVGIVPVGYADGFRRDLRGTEVLVAGQRAEVVGAVSMDAFAVRLPSAVDVGTPVTLVGPGVTFEHHARIAGTIGYEIACAIRADRPRGERTVIG